MKKTAFLILVMAFVLLLASCGQNQAKDTTVTAEEWDAMLALNNFTMEISITTEQPQNGITYFTADAVVAEATSGDMSIGNCFVKRDDGWHYYVKGVNESTYTQVSTLKDAELNVAYSLVGSLGTKNYEDFEYDKDKMAYVCEISDGLSVAMYVEDGRLVKAVSKSGEITHTQSYYNYGSTSVTLPEGIAE